MISRAAVAAWFVASTPAWRRFVRALDRPLEAQEQVLKRIVAAGAGSAFGREHELGRVRSIADFARAVPPRTWEGLGPWVERAVGGEARVLTTHPITRFEPTSGSTAARKLVPSTAASRRELDRAVAAWIVDTWTEDPRRAGPSYWSVSPSLPRERTPGGVPVGFDDDAAYLGGVAQHLVRRALVGPPPGLVGEPFWRATAAALLAEPDLRLISVWNPSFGVLLAEAVDRHLPAILPTLPARRARELERTGAAGAWPRLSLLSAWADAGAAGAVEALRERFPGVAFQAKGLLATEGIVSLPFRGTHPAAVTSSYLELRADSGEVRPLALAAPGDEGTVLLTTGAGLWRYDLRDRVRITGRLRATPTVRFLGREDRVSDRRGEKLAEPFVARVLHELDVRGFAMLAPEDRGYVLYAEEPCAAEALEAALRANPHYRWCVEIGQLAPARVRRVASGAAARYVAFEAARGLRWGDVKLPRLETRGGWEEVL